MFVISDDPVRDAAMYALERDEYDASLYPVCDICGEPIAPYDEYVEADDKTMHYECAENWLIKLRRVMPERG